MGRLFGRGDPKDDAPTEAGKAPDYNDADFQKRDLYNKGRNQMSNEKFLDAIRSFELAIRIDPQYVDAWVEKGYAHFHLGEYSVAISSYNRAIELDVEHSAACPSLLYGRSVCRSLLISSALPGHRRPCRSASNSMPCSTTTSRRWDPYQ